jgi:phosphoesterase RecJ-like protein
VGSVGGLAAILRANGFDAQGIIPDAVPGKYTFLAEGVPLRNAAEGERFDGDLLIVCDCTDLSRMGKLKREQFSATVLIDIDHHLNNPHFGAENWVDTGAAASAELVWRLAAQCGWAVPLEALRLLYVGLMTDTGQFSYSNTSPLVFRMAAEAVERGVDTEDLWQKIYLNKSRGELELESRARSSMQALLGGKICSIALRHADFSETGTGPQHTEEMAGIARSLAGVELALFMYGIQGGTKTKVSFRTTRHFDARALAQQFKGGGHAQAAGCTVELPLDEARPVVERAAEAFLQAALQQQAAR